MAKRTKGLAASSKKVDPTLNALFSASAGPVRAPVKSRYTQLLEKKPKAAPVPREVVTNEDEDDEGDDEVLSEISEELDYGDDDEEDDDNDDDDEDLESNNASETSEQAEEASEADSPDEPMNDAPVELDNIIQAAEGDRSKRERKRKRKDENEGLEDKYLTKLITEDEPEPIGKRQKGDPSEDDDEAKDDDDDDLIVHETLAKEDPNASDVEKASRTVFLANVSTDAISSKAARRTLLAHMSSVLDKEAKPAQAIESIRFRSVAFAGGALPKRAAYITKTLMEATTKSANAYIVYSTVAAARAATSKLNGTEVLGRHIRVDSVAHPSPTAHRRCVFVGNLGFVDDETVINTDGDGKTTEKKRNKTPSDIEEGLWREFGKHGRVENVRVVRDPKTRVGKGFAYVQFYDANAVESALLLDAKKFPPMLPRPMRVTRAKDPRKTATAQERAGSKGQPPKGGAGNMKYRVKATPEQQSMAGRAGKLLGRSAAAQQKHGRKPSHNNNNNSQPQATGPQLKTPEQVIFEGRRASSRDALPKDLKGKKKGKSAKPKNRSARRAADWKKKS
ncbi:hypothetical protein G7046_g5271 [Stylonectria norvegica]|nr:hypothetical protein G7046_g5271 [Stylonectria norvegica]